MAQISFTQKPLRVAAALFIITTLYLVFTLTPQRAPFRTVGSEQSPGEPVEIGQHGNQPWDSPALKPEEVIKDAHKLPTADSFLPHFRAVTQMPGLSIAEAKASCNWLNPDAVNFQYGIDADWVSTDRSDDEVTTRRKQWHGFIEKELLPYEFFKDRFTEPRGIVIVAGNQKSMKRVRVILRQLTRLQSSLPVEIHYWADEMTPEDRRDIMAMWPLLYFNDLSATSEQNILKTNHDGVYINYQLKTAAVMNSRFAEPLLLDSDNIPLLDPEELYNSRVYKEYGTLFWPDIARTRPNNPIWAITNTPCKPDEYEQESGQLIVDKRRYFYHLQLAAWFNNNAGEYYNQFLLGDKDTFRFAWHALKTPFGAPARWLTSVGTLSPDPGSGPGSSSHHDYYCGHSFGQHHPDESDARIAFLHGGLVKTLPRALIRWLREARGGIFQAYKRSEWARRPDAIVNVSIKWDAAAYLPADRRPADLPVASCTDFWDVEPKPLDEILPGFEKTFEAIGGYWMLEDDTFRPG